MPKGQTVFNFIDLFAGAGGLSEGLIQARFNPIAHVEMNAMAARTLETRAAFHYLSKQQDGSLQFYYAYERGEITREELFEHVPPQVIATIINEELSDKVFVIPNKMSKNEKYIAYTRALSELVIVVDENLVDQIVNEED